MHLRFVLFGAVVVAVGFSCAQGSGGDSGGSGGYGGSVVGPTTVSATSGHPATTGTGGNGKTTTATTSTGSTTKGTGGAAATTGSGGASGAAGAGTTSSTGAGGACAATPCELVSPQCGCPAGKECSVDVNGNLGCAPAGVVVDGALCGAGKACEPGLICLQTSPTVATCNAFCAKDADCVAPGGLCIVQLNGANMMPIANVTICTQNCSPVTNTGCAAGLSCQVVQEKAGQMRFLTQCEGAGAGTKGATCTTSADCAASYGCFTTMPNDTCLQYCDVNSPACATCVGLVDMNMNPIKVGPTTYGVCQ